jgi:hypothetical protein
VLKRLLVVFVLAVSTIQISRAPIPADASGADDGAEVVNTFLEEVASRISRDRIGPTKASRLYATIAYGMLVASAKNNDPLLASVNEPVAGVDNGDIDPTLAGVAAGTSIARQMFRLKSDKATFAEIRDELLARLAEPLSDDVIASSVAIGLEVSDSVVERASTDGFAESQKMAVPVADEPGEWVPTQPGLQPPIDPGWGTLRTFFASSPQCTLPPPDRGASSASPYEEAAAEVAEVAANLTDDQKAIARFWADDRGRTGTPSGHWMMIALAAAKEKNMTGPETIRMVAHVMMGIADGFIVNWREKFRWMVERPITVLQRTDPTWSSYLMTPAFPEYPSGHSTISRIAADIITDYVGQWSFTDPGYGLTEQSRSQFEVTPRTFGSVDDAAKEASDSRLYGGIHYRNGLERGAELGTCIARQVLPEN